MLNWIKSHLVDDVKDAWKWWSVRSNAAGLAVTVAWGQLPSEFKDSIPGGLVTVLAFFCLAALLLRPVKQG